MNISNVMYERAENTVVYASFPQIDELRCAICEIDYIEVHKSSSKTNFQWQTMKCRLLIHLNSDVIASPVSGTERFIFIMTHKKFFELGKLEQVLRNLRLVYQGLRPVTVELYKICLQYTIHTKIAPLWNKVGQYFVEGREFYKSIEAIRALKLDIFTEEKEMCLQLHAMKVKISYIKLENYLESSVLSQFLADPKGSVDLSRYNFPFVHVLPSLKKGKLLSVSKEIPGHCIFKDYDQLRRHWKNMYGYSLPRNKGGILYYEIKFCVPRSSVFTYPDLCVIGPLNIIPNSDKDPTITNFLSNVLVKLPTICDKQLQISKHTPFHAKLLNTDSSRNKKLDTYHKKDSNLTPNKQLDFSTKYVDELTEHTSIPSTSSLKAQLTKIHQIHNTKLCENMKTDTSNRFVKESQNETLEAVCIENEVTKEKTISEYFEVQKPHSNINKGESVQGEKDEQNKLTLKEKLTKTKFNKSSKEPLQDMDLNIDVETMARNNKLHQIKNSVLSDWLKMHSIPHNTKGSKSDLINKILRHIRNTQQLKQFRV